MNELIKIPVLCVQEKSNYFNIPNLDLYDKKRDCRNYKGNLPVITHAPCQSWSRLKYFAKENKEEKDLAFFCFELVQKNGGIFEHPSGSSFFKAVNADKKKIISINQSWFGFPAKKTTYLYFNKIKPLSHILNFDAIKTTVDKISYNKRSLMPLSFCEWLVNNVKSFLQS